MSQNFQEEQTRILVGLLRASLFQKEYSLPFTPDAKYLYTLAKKHMITAVISDMVCTFPLSDGEKSAFLKEKNRVLQRQALFDIQKEKLFSSFEKEGIIYLPLKGDVFCNLYPRYGMREFSDCDVLVKEEALPKVESIFKQEGYEKKQGCEVHEVYQKPPVYNFEIHRKLFSESMKELSYFKTVFDRAKPKTEGACLSFMPIEDEYLYVLSHMSKHSVSGLGFRSYVDFTLYKSHIESVGYDRAYVEQKLTELGIKEFEAKVMDITNRLFLNEEMTLSAEELLKIASFGTYGTREEHIKNSLKKEGKSYLFKRIFPPYEQLAATHSALKKCALLYPFFVLFRLWNGVLNAEKRKNIAQELKIYKQEREKEVEKESNRIHK